MNYGGLYEFVERGMNVAQMDECVIECDGGYWECACAFDAELNPFADCWIGFSQERGFEFSENLSLEQRFNMVIEDAERRNDGTLIQAVMNAQTCVDGVEYPVEETVIEESEEYPVEESIETDDKDNFKNLLSQAYNQKNDCDTPVLLKYTKIISCNLDKIIYNLSHKSKFIYMNFPNNKCYIGIGQSLSDKIKSKEELIHLKNNKYLNTFLIFFKVDPVFH